MTSPSTTPETPAITLRGLTKNFGKTKVLRGLDVEIQPGTIVGLFGRNGVGKTTLMSILSNQERPTSGEALIFGEPVWENPEALSQICFIRENQKYPDESALKHVLRAAANFYPNWDNELADHIKGRFRLPEGTQIKKYSRGQLSALGILIGLASRAPVTFLDEPYLGLDPTARDMFYDLLIEDVGESPRTIVFSTHVIDEAANLFERVIVLDEGEIVLDMRVEEATESAYNIAGPALAVDELTRGLKVLKVRMLGGLKSATVSGQVTADLAEAASAARLEISPVSLQDLVSALGHREDTSSLEPRGNSTDSNPNRQVKELSR
ncbi:ABC-2 type transport system ATP-binding protein [Neomicrococcus aestuarii]|uniref:ABC-2 type transport system ATP-binding protein n=1 Tax=Neomicrococcus aestuarii TaxID=556325 RepID=A0A7W8TTH9_9MICC|nr:ABC transporter ATP-binding protein [Neomicrococcus aestuarii]MBB5512637.1 ABC-2 type transport system ATP-binding protein [Neomicrococcus aestuarii]